MGLSERDKALLARLEEKGLLDQLPEGFIETLSADNEEREAKEQAKAKEEREQTLSRIRKTNNPYQSVLLNHELIKLFTEKNIKVENAAHALKDVALVGVLLPDTPFVKAGMVHSTDLWDKDREMIVNVARSFSNAGIPIHPRVEFSIYNLLPPVSSDFLMSAHPCASDMDFKFPKADAVLISSIPKNGATPMNYDYEVDRGFPELTYDEILASRNCGIYTSVSRLHQDPDIWAQASFALNAKFIAVRGGTGDEISTNQIKDHEQSRLLIESTSRQGTGYVARASTLPDYKDHTDSSTPLGKAIQNALN